MATSAEVAGRWALVTGASSGLGVDFARELARRGCHLVLVARREERLRAVADELRREHGVAVEVVAIDLAERAAPETLHRRVGELGYAVDVLVNNAGLGVYGRFLNVPPERSQQILDVDVAALVLLTRLFAGDMVERGFGRILQVSSIGAFQPTPTYACYAAAKSFVLHFGEALHRELRGTGVSCTVICPGVSATEFFATAGQERTLYQRLYMMPSAAVARAGIEAMLAGRAVVIPGFANRLNALLVRLLPGQTSAWLAHAMMRRDPFSRRRAG
ncbi:MAG: SDR family oxidoreductase [Deltaproteobacteria bacterium]|nr:SDR family oxidoreductase [Deltaproteobacteria bacterium]